MNRGRVEAPGHIDSPGVQHSSTAEIISQKFKEFACHSCSSSSALFTYLL